MALTFAAADFAQGLRTAWQYRGDRPIVVVHQMARVGSKTIRQAIRDHLAEVRSFHTHYLHPATIERMRGRFRQRYHHTGRPGLYREYLHANWLASRIRRGEHGDWRIISLVRDPVARTVSAFFRHLPLEHPELGEAFRDDPANVPRLIELFRDPEQAEHEFALNWFDREVHAVFGVDVFDHAFPKQAGRQEYACDAGRLLVMRTEDLASKGGAVLGDFLAVGPLRLGHENRTVNLPYARAYRRFLDELRLTPAYLERMYGSRLARHFYTDDEIAGFRARWTVDA